MDCSALSVRHVVRGAVGKGHKWVVGRTVPCVGVQELFDDKYFMRPRFQPPLFRVNIITEAWGNIRYTLQTPPSVIPNGIRLGVFLQRRKRER